MKCLTLYILFFAALGSISELKAQSLVEDANLNTPAGSDTSFKETIKIISSSKKIFILTNNNQQLGPGDFVSLALDDKLAARAVVAKMHQGQVGIKILKIYSLAQWSRLQRNLDVQVIKGDDSYFGKKPEAPTGDTAAKIKDEEDLYSGDVVMEDELGLIEENKNRHIKPDNLVAVMGSFMTVEEVNKENPGEIRGTTLGASWAFQFTDNYFIEGIYGRTMFDNYPGDGSQTLINQFIGRIKYNFKGPLYTFFMPYIGFQNYSVVSPDAGKRSESTQTEIDNENDAIKKLQKSGPVAGVTILRRLVPGWFIKADLGTDIIDVGFAIEF